MNCRLLLLTLTCVFLAACSSKPSEITWYQLNDSIPLTTGNLPHKNYVQVSSIKVPDYLKQSKLVLRTAPFEMHFAASHLWVQTPEKEIRAALIADLNAQSGDYWFVNVDPTLSKNIKHRLSLEITHFYPTENSEVILHGYWTLVSDTIDGHNGFQFKADLQEDGFSHSVSQQRHLISQLAREITAQMHGK